MIDTRGEFLVRGLKLLNERGIKDVTDALVAIQQDRLTIGNLVSHTISTGTVEGLIGALTQVYGDQFKEDLGNRFDRVEVELDGKPKKPIIDDMDRTITVLKRIFEVRHIIIHEAPFEPPYKENELSGYFTATRQFLLALKWTIDTKLGGNFPLKQGDMNDAAAEGFRKAEEALTPALETASTRDDFDEISKSQKLWEAYAEQEANMLAGYLSEGAGTAAPMDYYGIKSALTHQRLQYLLRHYIKTK
jgi:hypothetical protein